MISKIMCRYFKILYPCLLSYSVMVTQQILILLFKVRPFVGHHLLSYHLMVKISGSESDHLGSSPNKITVVLVLAVSTLDCGSERTDSNSVYHPNISIAQLNRASHYG